MLIIADYNQGIIMSRMNMTSMEISYSETIDEFYKAKSVDFVKYKNTNKLLVVIDSFDNSSKFIILSIRLSGTSLFGYEGLKLIDGIAKYGDSKDEYASIIMSNSILIVDITRRNNVFRYIGNEDVPYAKFYKSKSSMYPILIYGDKNSFVGRYVSSNNGLLICSMGNSKTYNFELHGYSHNCEYNTEGIKTTECYYRIKMTLKPLKQNYIDIVNDFILIGIIIGIIGIVIISIIIIVLIIVLIKYRFVNKSLLKYNDPGISQLFIVQKRTESTIVIDQIKPTESNMIGDQLKSLEIKPDQ